MSLILRRVYRYRSLYVSVREFRNRLMTDRANTLLCYTYPLSRLSFLLPLSKDLKYYLILNKYKGDGTHVSCLPYGLSLDHNKFIYIRFWFSILTVINPRLIFNGPYGSLTFCTEYWFSSLLVILCGSLMTITLIVFSCHYVYIYTGTQVLHILLYLCNTTLSLINSFWL